MAESGHLPAVAERIACAGWIFEILDLDGKRIDKVLAQPTPWRRKAEYPARRSGSENFVEIDW
jgi:CBS domain containing-hemolysin-like protein